MWGSSDSLEPCAYSSPGSRSQLPGPLCPHGPCEVILVLLSCSHCSEQARAWSGIEWDISQWAEGRWELQWWQEDTRLGGRRNHGNNTGLIFCDLSVLRGPDKVQVAKIWKLTALPGVSHGLRGTSKLLLCGGQGLGSASYNCFYQHETQWLWFHINNQTWLKWIYYYSRLIFHSNVYISSTVSN